MLEKNYPFPWGMPILVPHVEQCCVHNCTGNYQPPRLVLIAGDHLKSSNRDIEKINRDPHGAVSFK